MYFLCPHCKKAPRSLPGHLRKVCMRDRADAEIQATVIQAKKELAEFTHKGRFWEYQSIKDILATADPLARLLEEMQKRGLVVTNKPPVLPSPTRPVPSLPSSAPQSPGEGANEPHIVPNMTVQEREGRTHVPNGASVAVKEEVTDDKENVSLYSKLHHNSRLNIWWIKSCKTSASYVCLYGFGLFFNKVRLAALQGNDAPAEDKSLVLSIGRPIYNPGNDSNRLHAK
ncbi:hypothetical protein DPX16_0109 [Anabarilius grahami]|uniref:Uncharacterized protein n=1 Tax=Anabarilius grahami TaxID=495550 RepID=A0A3N0YFA6_ANAGA|nr:hypothetical protein DPX16_0109 [Anabarilius grahami]